MQHQHFRYHPYHTKINLFSWAERFNTFAILESGHLAEKYAFIIGVSLSSNPDFFTLEEIYNARKEKDKSHWYFGYIPYEYKNEIEPKLFSNHRQKIGDPYPIFFKADVVIFRSKNSPFIEILSDDPQAILKDILQTVVNKNRPSFKPLRFESYFTKKSYIDTIKHLQEHIRSGDVYEINLTQEFQGAFIGHLGYKNVLDFFNKNPVSMAAWMRLNSMMILSASPERFLQKEGLSLTSEPIKGTIKRKKGLFADRIYQSELRKIKYEAENVMIVDLVRNDLNRVCTAGTVHVPDLFRIKTYKNLHHLVSTVKGTLSDTKNGLDAIHSCFPPGSMTGAPKIRSMQLINEYEPTARGIYSGALGYIAPEKNFDFNVVIRTLVMDLSSNIMSYHVGGAITIDSDPVAEYEESLLKAQFIKALE